MRPELERLHDIEQHLLGRTTAEDAAAWQVRLLVEPDLEADVEAQQHVYRQIMAGGRRQLRQELRGIHEQLYGPARPPLTRLRNGLWALRAWWHWVRLTR